jgi:hypothetical protein
VEFDGSGDKLSVGSSPSTFNFGTNPFTIEMWVFTKQTGIQALFNTHRVGVANGYLFAIDTNNKLVFANYGFSGSADNFTSNDSISLNKWHHIAVVREGTGTDESKIYIDGNVALTFTDTVDYSAYTYGPYIGGYDDSSYPLNGYISNLRVVNGTAVYTSSFTPSSQNLTAISNTVLLSCQSNRFIDNSTNVYTIAPTGDPKISSFNPFGQGSEYAVGENKGSSYWVDNSSNYLNLGSSFDFYSSTDWGIQCWVYPNSTQRMGIIADRNSISTGGITVHLTDNGDGTLTPNAFFPASSGLGSNVSFKPYEWNHIHLKRIGTTAYWYINGELGNSGAWTSTPSSSENMVIGKEQTSTTENFDGYISDLKIMQSNVSEEPTTLPTAPVGNTNAYFYLPFDNAGIYDKTGNNTLTLVGNTSTSTTQTKFADTAMYFDGTGDGAEFGDQTTLKYLHDKTSNYTIECWIYPTSVSGRRAILMTGAASASAGALLELNGSEVDYTIYRGVSGSLTSISGGTVTVNQWSHVAVTYDGTDVEVFLNGTSIGSTTWSLAASSSSSQVVPSIGRDNASSAVGDFYGYIENFQVLKGVAKYTANFTPPTQTQGRTYQAED